MIKVLLADDHALFRSGIRQLLSLEDDLEVVGEVADGDEVIAALRALRPDVLVLDLSMRRVGGAELLRQVVEAELRVAVVVLTMYAAGQFAAHLIRLGASAYLTKDDSPEELLQAIRAVAAGRVHLTAAVRAFEGAQPDGAPPHELLSVREFQVFIRLAEGRTVSEIAAELDVRVSTVSSFVARIKEKLGAASVGELVVYAHRAGLVG